MVVSPQVLASAAVLLVLAAICCIVRLYSLHLMLVYPSVVFFLFTQVVTTVFSNVTGAQTNFYAYCYLALLVLEWVAYGLVIRQLYNSIFSRYPGIATLGQWSIYCSMAATLAIFLVGITSVVRKIAQIGTVIVAFEFASRCFLFGFAALIVIVLIAISKYPLELHKNILVNYVVFSVILLTETAGLLADQLTSRAYTTNLNFGIEVVGVICLAIWPFALSREGQTKILKLHDYSPSDEARLLGQLGAVNALLLRAARK